MTFVRLTITGRIGIKNLQKNMKNNMKINVTINAILPLQDNKNASNIMNTILMHILNFRSKIPISVKII